MAQEFRSIGKQYKKIAGRGIAYRARQRNVSRPTCVSMVGTSRN